jgi:hypothetical protein
VGALVGSLAACDDLLDVQDPSRFTDEDLDNALPAVAVGVEGNVHTIIDGQVIYSALMTDVFQHTGTWIGYDDTDHGLVEWERNTFSGGGTLTARYAGEDAMARFERLEGEGETVPQALWDQVRVSHGWADLLYAGMHCEGPLGQATAASSDMAFYAQARANLQAALDGGATGDFALWARAGIARAELMQGNYAAADAAAAAVIAAAPADWEKLALFQQSTMENSIVNLNTWGYNHAAGIREKWWPLVDDAARLMRDPISGELDSRVPIRHEAGILGVDGVTEFYSQWKYQLVGSDIPLTHVDEMWLIRAEVAWLSPAVAATSAEVFTVLLNERFAELFMEGHRMQDLHRFGLVDDGIAAGDFDPGTTAIRPTKFPMSQSEAINNGNIEDEATARCLPLSG